jgi:cell division septal protein FtsQ
VLLFSTATYLLAWSPVFVVKDIEITGAPTSDSSKAISKALAITTGEKLARVEPRSLQRRLDSFDWISDVNISRDWIKRKVSIEISSRTPIALFNPDTSLQTTIDTTGKVFRLPGGAPNSLPRVQAATPESGVAAIGLFTELPESFRSEITLMNVRSSGSFEVSYSYKSRQIQIAWGDGKESALKVEVASKLLALPENSKIRFIDVSAPYAPIVR